VAICYNDGWLVWFSLRTVQMPLLLERTSNR